MWWVIGYFVAILIFIVWLEPNSDETEEYLFKDDYYTKDDDWWY